MLRPDCRYFLGDKPCRFRRLCGGCPHFEPFHSRILIIKCRAQGDVLRTTPLLPALKKKFPLSHITWLVDEESRDLLQDNPYIDSLYVYNLENVLPLLVEKFDLLLSLDKEPGLTALAARIEAARKLGFGMNDKGNLTVFNPASEYAWRLGVDDELKFFHNRKTYQEIVHEIAELPFERDEYVFVLPDEAGVKAERFFRRHRIGGNRLTIGLNTGAGAKFETKQWPPAYYVELIALLRRKLGAAVFLLGGRREREMNRAIARRSRAAVYDTGSENSLLEFAGFISKMDLVVCSDTLGMHIAIALKKKAVVLFGPTCPQEIDLYGRGVKLFAAVSCAPCYKKTCPDVKCMKEITPEGVYEEVRRLV